MKGVAAWRWTCEQCGESEQGEDVLALDHRFCVHASSHVSGPFGVMPRALMEILNPAEVDLAPEESR